MTPRMSSSRTSVYFCSSSFTSVPPYLLTRTRSPDLDLEGVDLAVLVPLAGAERDDFGLLGLFLSAVRDDDASADLLFVLEMLHENAITYRSDFDFSHMGFVLG